MYIKQYCDQFDLSDTWCSQGARYKHKIARVFKQCLDERYDSNWWRDMCREDSKLRTYKDFKNNVEIENYLLTIKNPKIRQ